MEHCFEGEPGEAIAVCSICAVVVECRGAVEVDPETPGVWAGTTPMQRRQLRRDASEACLIEQGLPLGELLPYTPPKEQPGNAASSYPLRPWPWPGVRPRALPQRPRPQPRLPPGHLAPQPPRLLPLPNQRGIRPVTMGVSSSPSRA